MYSLEKIISRAEKTIFLADNFLDNESFRILSRKKDSVLIKIYSRNEYKVKERNIRRRVNFRAGVKIYETKEFRDRIIIIDEKIMYVLSGSIRDFSRGRGHHAVRIFDYNEVQRQLLKMKMCEVPNRRSL